MRWLALCMTLAVLVPLAVPLALIYLLVLPLALASGSATSVVVQKVWMPVFRSQTRLLARRGYYGYRLSRPA